MHVLVGKSLHRARLLLKFVLNLSAASVLYGIYVCPNPLI